MTRFSPKRNVIGLTTIALFGIAVSAPWQGGLEAGEPLHKNTIISRVESAELPGQEVVVTVVELGPGAPIEKHYHPGTSFGTVLEGSFYTESEGEPRQTLKVGDSWVEAPKHVHWGANASSTESAKFIVVRVLPKGQPVTVPVK